MRTTTAAAATAASGSHGHSREQVERPAAGTPSDAGAGGLIDRQRAPGGAAFGGAARDLAGVDAGRADPAAARPCVERQRPHEARAGPDEPPQRRRRERRRDRGSALRRWRRSSPPSARRACTGAVSVNAAPGRPQQRPQVTVVPDARDLAGELRQRGCGVGGEHVADLLPGGVHELLLVVLHDARAEAGRRPGGAGRGSAGAPSCASGESGSRPGRSAAAASARASARTAAR